MAIERIEKISLIVPRDLEGHVVETLTRMGTVHLDQVCEDDYMACKTLSEDEAEEFRRRTFELSKVEFLLGFLRKHSVQKPGLINTLIKPKYHMTFDEFLSTCDCLSLDRIYDDCFRMDRRLQSFNERLERLEREREELSFWADLEFPMNELHWEPYPVLRLVRIASGQFDGFEQELENSAPASCVEVVGGDEEWAACVLINHPSVNGEVANALDGVSHEAVTLRDLSEEPLERLEQVQRGINALERRRRELLAGIESYLDMGSELEVFREYLLDQRRRLELTTSFGSTKTTVVIEGWVTESGLPATMRVVRDLSEDLVVETRPPGEDEEHPVSLKNRGWIAPFELITKLYGIPNAREYDPTWIIAISFTIFFGFCIADVGYGALIIVAFLLMRRFLPLGQKTRDLLLVMVYGGAFAILFGVLTGSWFGYDPEKLPQFMQSMQVFDPLSDPIPVMLVCLVIGLLHMLSGTVVEMRDNWRYGKVADALIDQGLILLLFVGGAIAAGFAAARLVPFSVVFIVAGAALAGMIVLGGHHNRSVPGKMFGGLYETYNTVVGWLGDTVSYLRLFALGLATFAVAWVINILAGMAKGVGPVIGIVLMLIIIVVGHVFNVTVNLLSAFVHPLRLEYVEFFGKFYEAGGREFRPLKVESKTVLIEEYEKGRRAP